MAMSRAEELAAIEAAIKAGKRQVLDPITDGDVALQRERVMREARSQARMERHPGKAGQRSRPRKKDNETDTEET